MGRARTWKLAGAGAVVAALGVGGVTALGGAPSSASTAHDHPPSHGPQGRGPADQGPPGLSEGTTLTVGGTVGTPTTGTTSTGTTLDVSSYDFAATAANTGTSATGATGATATSAGLTPGTLVVTTSLAAQSELSSLTGTSAELVARHGRGPSSLDATFAGLTLDQYEMSSADGGSLTLTFTFSKVTYASPTTSNGSNSGTNSNS